MRALLELTRMRVLLLLRQPEIIFWAFVFPVMLSIVLGLAFRDRQAAASRVAVLDGPFRAEVLAAFEEDARIDAQVVEDADQAARLLRSGAVDAALSGLGADSGELVLRYDEARAEAEVARLRVDGALQRHAGRQDLLTLELVTVQESGSRYVDWFVPGLLGLSIMSTSIWAVGFAFVEARQRRLIKRFLTTPMHRASYLLAHVLARLCLLGLEVGLLMAFARYVLDVPFRGSIPAFVVLCVVGGLVFSGMGVLLGSRVRTPEAAAGLINLSMMPMGLASGVFFSYERFSETLVPLIQLLPLAAMNDALRAVMLEGQGLDQVLPEIAIQLTWGVVTFLIGLAIFRWK